MLDRLDLCNAVDMAQVSWALSELHPLPLAVVDGGRHPSTAAGSASGSGRDAAPEAPPGAVDGGDGPSAAASRAALGAVAEALWGRLEELWHSNGGACVQLRSVVVTLVACSKLGLSLHQQQVGPRAGRPAGALLCELGVCLCVLVKRPTS